MVWVQLAESSKVSAPSLSCHYLWHWSDQQGSTCRSQGPRIYSGEKALRTSNVGNKSLKLIWNLTGSRCKEASSGGDVLLPFTPQNKFLKRIHIPCCEPFYIGTFFYIHKQQCRKKGLHTFIFGWPAPLKESQRRACSFTKDETWDPDF